ncbi:MAG TPA: hypothetical protein VFN71_09930 [Methylomirabilota bacterium]|nr:hypothetical protein [Methylomirabilota bacterium]
MALATVASSDNARPFCYAYYLFELPKETRGCSDCYIPLVLARDLIEQAPKQKVVVIITYERDSIWTWTDDLLEIDAEGSDAPARTARYVKLQGRTYRYQRVPNADAARLLENPRGQIPIHRALMPMGSDAFRTRLLRDLRGEAAR